MPSSDSKKETKLSREMERRLAAIRRSNPTCADCPAEKPQWLGNERCTVKSLEMAHEWNQDDIKVLEYTGNSFVNSVLEANVVDFDKNLVVACEEKEDKRRARFIKYKYKKRSYLDDVVLAPKPTPPPADHREKNKNEFSNFQLAVRAHTKMQNEDRRLSTTDRGNRRRKNVRRGTSEKILGTQPNNKEGETANDLTASDHPTRAGSLLTTEDGNRRRRRTDKTLGTSLPTTNGGNRRSNLRRGNNADDTDPGNRRKTLCRGNSLARDLAASAVDHSTRTCSHARTCSHTTTDGGNNRKTLRRGNSEKILGTRPNNKEGERANDLKASDHSTRAGSPPTTNGGNGRSNHSGGNSEKINKPRRVIEDKKKRRGEEHQTYLKKMEGEEAKKIVDSPPYNDEERETANDLTASAVDQVTRTCSQPTTDRGNRRRKTPIVVALPKLEMRISCLGAVGTIKQYAGTAA